MENNSLKFSKSRFYVILTLIVVGLLLCIELSYIFFKTNFSDVFAPSFCTVSELIDCDGVALTKYSVSMGVPNSLWGLFVYSILLMLLFVDRIQARFKNTIFDVFKNPSSYIATLALLSFAISMILASISIFKINKICVLCFCTYFVDLFIAFAAKQKGMFVEDIKTTILDFVDGVKKYTILFIVVLVAFITTLVVLDKTMIFSPKIKKERAQKEFFADTNKYAIKGNILGNENAPVVVKIYSDFNCPFCRVVNIMIHKIARNENIFVEEVNFPLDTTCNNKIGGTLGGHENSCMYSRYALAAKKQGKFWGAANVLFYKNPKTENELINQFKRAHLGLDIVKLNYDANSPLIYQELSDDIMAAFSKGINGTPAIEINGVVYMGSLPYEELLEKIQLAIKRAEN